MFPLHGETLEELKNQFYLDRHTPEEEDPAGSIEIKNEVIYLRGEGTAAILNNRAADLILQGGEEEAIKLLKKGLEKDGLFLPFQYNLGVAYIYARKFKRAMLHLQKARAVAPYYSQPWLQIGYVYQLQGNKFESIDAYRKALKLNPSNLTPYIRIGDLYFNRDQLDQAFRYYNAALEKDSRYPDGLIGKGKIYYRKEEYVRALVMFKSVETDRPYDKSMHFYYGETAFKMRDYKTARDQYRELLKYQNDKFFLTTSPSLVRHKLNLSEKFISP